MQLGKELRVNNPAEYQPSQAPLTGELDELKRIHRGLTHSGDITSHEAREYIDSFYRIINDNDDFKYKIENEIDGYDECVDLINKISLVIDNSDYDNVGVLGGFPGNAEDNAVLEHFYNKLEKINAILSDPKTTEEQALRELKTYDYLMSNKVNIKLMNQDGNKVAVKAREISGEIQDYFIRKDMITFGYFVDKMDRTSKYAYDISVVYQRESMSKYVDFYRNLTSKLNTFGGYIKESINDGKQNNVYKRQFYTSMYNELKNYFYYGDGDGEGYILYSNKVEVIKTGNDKFDVYIGGNLIEKGISYEDAYNKIIYFFSSHEPVAKGTRMCKLLKPIKDKNGNIQGIEGRVEQFLFPPELYNFMDLGSREYTLKDINKNFDANISTLSKWDNVNEKTIASTSDVEKTKNDLKENYAAGVESYYTNETERNEPSKFYQHEINTMNQKIDGAKKGLQLTLDEYTQRYNTINSNYDNMLRTITTMISDLTQELKGFLRF